jgi:hypothetical protein
MGELGEKVKFAVGGFVGVDDPPTTTLCSTVAVRPAASVTTRRTYFVPTSWKVNCSVCPLPRGQITWSGLLGEPSSDQS